MLVMSSRPKRSTANQKDASNDMLGLSRQEERMLQKAMYDSLRHQNKYKFHRLRKPLLQRKSMTTRSMAVTRLSITVPDSGVPETTAEPLSQGDCTRADDEAKVEQEIKRGTRYSPMRKGPLSEMLKSLENKKTQIEITPSVVLVRPLTKRNIKQIRKKDNLVRDIDPCLTIKSAKVVIENLDLKRSARSPRGSKIDNKRLRLSSSKSKSPLRGSPAKSPNSPNKKTNQRIPRTASLAARSYWLSQVSDTPSPTKVHSKTSASAPAHDVNTSESNANIDTKVTKPLIYNRKAISTSQRMSRNILATAAKRVKRAKLKGNGVDTPRKNNSKARTMKDAEAKHNQVVPPELWLDPKGRPVDTQDFINFLLFKDTPYLDPALKWFHLPPNRRKQRFYKVIHSEPGLKFNETVVYAEKKDGGGKEVVVHCIPPKLIDEGSELISSTSDQSSTRGDNKVKLSVSCNSSCHTHAAVDDEPLIIQPDITNTKQTIQKSSPGPGRPRTVPAKVSPVYEYRSKHIMQTRKRGA